MLRPGDLIPRFEGATSNGRPVEYDQLWQRRNIVLFVLPAELIAAASPYLGAVERRLSELKPSDTSLVISDHILDGLPLNSLAIADRWAEIAYSEQLAPEQKAWPSIDEVLEWVEFIRVKCPECPP